MNSYNLETVSNLSIEKIVYVSDLHFDFFDGKFSTKHSMKMENNFIDIITRYYPENVIVIAGDFYNDFRKTIKFINKLEKANIVGFFVLGNHDYWNNKRFTMKDVVEEVDKHTKSNRFFRYLKTGEKFVVDSIVFIGDTGWTSFENDQYEGDLNTFRYKFPEFETIKDFSFEQILNRHNKWIEFANDVLEKEEKVIVVTHHPMINLGNVKKDVWWSSNTKLSKTANYWNIFGHTHNDSYMSNHVSKQIGYKNKSHIRKIKGERKTYYYRKNQFNTLIRLSSSNSLIECEQSLLSQHYSNRIIPKEATALLIEYERRGFKRCGANKKNFVSLINDFDKYISKIEKRLHGYEDNVRIGYVNTNTTTKDVLSSIYDSIEVLKRGNTDKIKEYITAAVITGYVWNDEMRMIPYMRPLDDYDVIRFYLMFKTIREFGIDLESINKVHKHQKHFFEYGNVKMFIPKVNNNHLSLESLLENSFSEQFQIEFNSVKD